MSPKFTFILFIIFITSPQGFSQTYRTKDNRTGDWHNPSTWLGNVLLDRGQVEIYGRVTSNGGLSVENDLYIYDSLWINGDLNMKGGSTLTLETSGVLIVSGDLNGTSFWLIQNFNVDVENAGRIVVLGDVNIREFLTGGEMDIQNNGDFYVYGDVNTSGGATFTGSYGDEQDLMNDPSLYDLVNGGTLPVTFTFVTARDQQDQVEISWATGTEENNDYFTVQRSLNGTDFSDLGQLDGAGNSSQTREYSFMDKNPVTGTSYYRIKQTDYDGRFDYSEIIRMFRSTFAEDLEPSLQVYPNPSSGEINLRFHRFDDAKMAVRIYNDQGTVVYTKDMQLNQNEGKINLHHFVKGYYLLEVLSTDTIFRKRILLN